MEPVRAVIAAGVISRMTGKISCLHFDGIPVI
jgi:hypothetical protein